MAECEKLGTCPIFSDNLKTLPNIAILLKETYCLADKTQCARYRVSRAGTPVPPDLLPNDCKRVSQILGVLGWWESDIQPWSEARATLASGMSEAKAIEGAKQGDGECFEFLYSRHKKRVYSLCLRMVGNIEAAEDFTQEAFLLLFRKIVTFRGDSAFSTWLHRITVNIVLISLRKKGLSAVSLEEILEPREKDGPREDFCLTGPIDRMILESAIGNLSPSYRNIFVLHDVEGYEHGEIAEILGCSISSSKSQLHMARLKLRGLLMTTRVEADRHKSFPKMNTARGGTLAIKWGAGATTSC